MPRNTTPYRDRQVTEAHIIGGAPLRSACRAPVLVVSLASALLLVCAGGQGPRIARAPVERVAEVRAVFIGTFGRTPDAEAARAEMRVALEREARFVVVESAQLADAMITGEVVVRRASSGRPKDLRAYGELRMVRPDGGRVFWRHVYEPRDVEPQTIETTPTELIRRMVQQFSDDLHRLPRS